MQSVAASALLTVHPASLILAFLAKKIPTEEAQEYPLPAEAMKKSLERFVTPFAIKALREMDLYAGLSVLKESLAAPLCALTPLMDAQRL